jgi:Rrf2 family protein
MLTKTAEYALRAVASLAQEGQQARSADDLAEQTQVPRRYLHKVLQDLCRAKLVRSRSGPGGGYTLVKLPDQISILDVVNAVAPLRRIHSCPLGIESHSKLCPLHKELDRAYAETEKSFALVTIGQLVGSRGKIKPLCELPSS